LRFYADGTNPVRDEITWTRLIASGIKNQASIYTVSKNSTLDF